MPHKTTATIATAMFAILLAAGCGGDKHYSDYKSLVTAANLPVLSADAAKSAAESVVCDSEGMVAVRLSGAFPKDFSDDTIGVEMAAIQQSYC